MRFAVIPSRGRPCLVDSVNAIKDQVDHVIVLINHRDEGAGELQLDGENVDVIVDADESPVNLSALWNIGLDEAASIATSGLLGITAQSWNVAVLNDDAIVPPGWMERVCTEMRNRGCAAASTATGIPAPLVHRQAGPVNLFLRLSGWAFVLRGESGLRADETFQYWYGDDDLGWRAADAGGVLILPGGSVPNLYPNGQVTPELQEQISRDRIAFGQKWGKFPW